MENILTVITILTTWVFGYFAKKSKFINNNLIPVQNIAIGVIFAIVEWIITKDFKTALALSGLFAGGLYDVGHNIKKIIEKK